MKRAQPEMKMTSPESKPASKPAPGIVMKTSSIVTVTTNAIAPNNLKSDIKSYEDIKGHLSTVYAQFISNPESLGIAATEAKEIKDSAPLLGKGMWVAFKKYYKIELKDMNKSDLAFFLNEDAREDGVIIAKETLKAMFKDPDNPNYHLESEMIDTIKAMSSSEKDELLKATASLNNITLNESAGHKILSFIKDLWTEFLPTFEKIMSPLVKKGITELGHIMDQKFSADVSDAIEEGLGDLGKTVIEVSSKTVTKLIKNGLEGTSALVTLQETASIIGTKIGVETAEAAQKIVKNNTDKVMKSIEDQLGLGSKLMGAHIDPPVLNLSGDTNDVEHHS